MDHRYVLYNHRMLTELRGLADTVQARADLMRRTLLNRALTAGGLAEGTNAATIKTANTVTYLADGVFKSKGATDNIAIPAGTTLADGEFCKFLVSLQADGTPVVTQGVPAASAALALLPAVPADEAPISYFQIETSGATYIPGTTDNGAGTVTDTYVDIAWPDSGADSFDALGTLAMPSDTALGEIPKFR